MSAERAVALNANHRVVNPSVRLPAERSSLRGGTKTSRQGAAGSWEDQPGPAAPAGMSRDAKAYLAATCLFPVWFAVWAWVLVSYLNAVLA